MRSKFKQDPPCESELLIPPSVPGLEAEETFKTGDRGITAELLSENGHHFRIHFLHLSLAQSGRGTRNAKKPLKGFQGWDKNGPDESFKMSPHLICLSWHFNFHIISRPDPEAGHKRDLGCQPRHIKWGLISKLSMSPFSRHPQNRLRGFFPFRLSLPDCACVAGNFFLLWNLFIWLLSNLQKVTSLNVLNGCFLVENFKPTKMKTCSENNKGHP